MIAIVELPNVVAIGLDKPYISNLSTISEAPLVRASIDKIGGIKDMAKSVGKWANAGPQFVNDLGEFRLIAFGKGSRDNGAIPFTQQIV
eukprot:scaffold206506_cov55-Attheya_sp.AAC.2